MYVYLVQNITQCDGDVVGNRCHLLNLDSIPSEPIEKQMALDETEKVFGFDENSFTRILDNISGYESSSNMGLLQHRTHMGEDKNC